MKKKGFTLIEMIGVIVLLAVVTLISVPTYMSVRDNINESVYESKVSKVLAAAESYGEETGRVVFDVRTLINEGKLTADNELEEYKDPRTKRDMACDILNIIYQEGMYKASITESTKCFDQSELDSYYGMVELYYEDETGKEIKESESGWLKRDNVYVGYRFKERYQEYAGHVKKFWWSGAQDSDENRYLVTATSVRNLTVTLHITVEINGIEITNEVSKEVRLDIQRPNVVDGSILMRETASGGNRRVEFEITDGSGSGVKSYGIVSYRDGEHLSCDNRYESVKKNSQEGLQTEYLGNGKYYICVEDKVGNKTSDEDLKNDRNLFEVSNVDSGAPSIEKFQIQKRNEYAYNNTIVDLIISAKDDMSLAESLKMCISNEGYLKCEWENYNTYKEKYNLGGSLDGKVRTVYLTIRDEAGNMVNKKASYTVYEECSETVNDYKSWSSCEDACKSADHLQRRKYDVKDKYTNKVCKSNQEEKREVVHYGVTNVIQEKDNKTWYQKLSVTTSLPPGTTSSKYCVTPNETCTPNTPSLRNPYVLPDSANAQRICVQPSGNNVSNCSCCSPAYAVDGAKPSVAIDKIDINKQNGNVTVSVSANDSHSKVRNYHYRLDNGEWSSLTAAATYTYIGVRGTHTITVGVYDNAGNYTEVSKTFQGYVECTETKDVIQGDWSTCSVSCGGGKQKRSYVKQDIYTGKVCQNNLYYEQECNTQSCCSKKEISRYGNWKSCSVSCGGGIQYRDVYYKSSYNGEDCGSSVNADSQKCNEFSCCSKTVTTYGNYGACDATCGDGYQSRLVTYKSFYDGSNCGSTTEKKSCNVKSCTEYRSRQVVDATFSKKEVEPSKLNIYKVSCSRGKPFQTYVFNSQQGLCDPPTYMDCQKIYGLSDPLCLPAINSASVSLFTHTESCPDNAETVVVSSKAYDGVVAVKVNCYVTDYSCSSGYTLNGTKCYGPWSAWSSTPITGSDHLEVETRVP